MTGSHEVTGSIPVGSTTPPTATADLAIHIFEDDAPPPLRPLLRLRPACELRAGAFSLRERCEMLGVPVWLAPREALRGLVRDSLWRSEGAVAASRWLSLNARANFGLAKLRELGERARREDFALVQDGVLVAASAGTPSRNAKHAETISTALWTAPWELVQAIGSQIDGDFDALRKHAAPALRSVALFPREDASYRQALAVPYASGAARIDPGVHLIDADRILLSDGAHLQPGVVLDAEAGPILVGAGARIAANSTVVGPSVIGPGARVHPNSKLREGSVVGALCRVGGEIEESILLEASNKQHDGFLGHAVLASWVNLGANTTVSDLKNNYGNVRVDVGDGPVDSGQRFVGPTIGDHTKTAIGTLLGTGSVVDVACNVLGPGFPPRYLAPYSWGGAGGVERTQLEKAIATMRTVVERREALFPASMEALLRALYATC